jgi:hypothetical protein
MPDKLRAVLIGAVIAALGALIGSIPLVMSDAETVAKLGPYGPYMGMAAAIGVNVLRKVVEFLNERKKQLES